MIDWKKLTETEIEIIGAIVKRAEKDLNINDNLPLAMDLSVTHLICPLRLNSLLLADSENFSHDIRGIQKHLDREGPELTNYFIPRYAKEGN